MFHTEYILLQTTCELLQTNFQFAMVTKFAIVTIWQTARLWIARGPWSSTYGDQRAWAHKGFFYWAS